MAVFTSLKFFFKSAMECKAAKNKESIMVCATEKALFSYFNGSLTFKQINSIHNFI